MERPLVNQGREGSLDRLEREQFARKYDEMHRLVREPDGTAILYIGAENWPFPIPLRFANGRWSFDAEAGADEILYRRIGVNETRAIDVCRTRPTLTPQGTRDGYRFRAVTGQADIAKGKSITGIALVAYPVEYRSTGVMTFIATADGDVYQKDLGPDTSTVAAEIADRVHVAGWKAVK